VTEEPPSDAITWLGLIAAGVVMIILVLILILVGTESDAYLFVLVFSIFGPMVAWWAARRTKKWTRIRAERREKENQYLEEI
jgi:hypothetical protein